MPCSSLQYFYRIRYERSLNNSLIERTPVVRIYSTEICVGYHYFFSIHFLVKLSIFSFSLCELVKILEYTAEQLSFSVVLLNHYLGHYNEQSLFYLYNHNVFFLFSEQFPMNYLRIMLQSFILNPFLFFYTV